MLTILMLVVGMIVDLRVRYSTKNSVCIYREKACAQLRVLPTALAVALSNARARAKQRRNPGEPPSHYTPATTGQKARPNLPSTTPRESTEQV